MRLITIVAVLSVAGGLSYAAPTTQPDDRGEKDSRQGASVAAEAARLDDPDPKVRAAAVAALARVGAPAAPVLVGTLADPRNESRSAAAEALRAVLAADPAAAPNYHDKAFWEKRIAQVQAGVGVGDALNVLLPDTPPADRRAAVQAGAWSGQSGFSIVRLDDYWTATLSLVDAGRERLAKPPSLTRSVRAVWLPPPEDYSGVWTTWFVNGQKSNEIDYRNGRYDGTFTAFHDDGSRSYEQHYQAGVCDGPDTGWYRGGAKMYEAHYKADKQDGVWRHWYPDGKPQSIEEYKAGVLDGVSTTWHENGQKRQEQHYRDGKQDGSDTCWDEDGKRLWSRTFLAGKLVASD